MNSIKKNKWIDEIRIKNKQIILNNTYDKCKNYTLNLYSFQKIIVKAMKDLEIKKIIRVYSSNIITNIKCNYGILSLKYGLGKKYIITELLINTINNIIVCNDDIILLFEKLFKFYNISFYKVSSISDVKILYKMDITKFNVILLSNNKFKKNKSIISIFNSYFYDYTWNRIFIYNYTINKYDKIIFNLNYDFLWFIGCVTLNILDNNESINFKNNINKDIYLIDLFKHDKQININYYYIVLYFFISYNYNNILLPKPIINQLSINAYNANNLYEKLNKLLAIEKNNRINKINKIEVCDILDIDKIENTNDLIVNFVNIDNINNIMENKNHWLHKLILKFQTKYNENICNICFNNIIGTNIILLRCCNNIICDNCFILSYKKIINSIIKCLYCRSDFNPFVGIYYISSKYKHCDIYEYIKKNKLIAKKRCNRTKYDILFDILSNKLNNIYYETHRKNLRYDKLISCIHGDSIVCNRINKTIIYCKKLQTKNIIEYLETNKKKYILLSSKYINMLNDISKFYNSYDYLIINNEKFGNLKFNDIDQVIIFKNWSKLYGDTYVFSRFLSINTKNSIVFNIIS